MTGGRHLRAIPAQPVDRGAVVLELRRRAAEDPAAPDLDAVVADPRVALLIARDEIRRLERIIADRERQVTVLRDLVHQIERVCHANAIGRTRDAGVARAVLDLIHPTPDTPSGAA